MLIFVSGAVRSGKSTFAESLVKQYTTRAQYIATSIRVDDEMDERIAHHREQRTQGEICWQTWEQPRHLHELIFQQKDVVLLDCLTILTANELFYDRENIVDEDVFTRIYNGILHITAQCSVLVIVSNEIFYEGIPDDVMTRQYVRLLGKLHQAIVRDADEAYVVKHGIATKMKGREQ
jgi:adenosylcobinamide kinase / adenosylcobinamide-phosphate guanylyltransferase